MRVFRSPWGLIELTEERKQHILLFHPDVVACFRFFGTTVSKPQKVLHSENDKNVMICYSLSGVKKEISHHCHKIKTEKQFYPDRVPY